MSHNIEENKAFFTGQPAWHGLGTVLKDAPSIDEAWKLAYPHELFKMNTAAIVENADGEIVEFMKLAKRCAVIRDDGKEIGSVGPDYCLEQPHEVMTQTFAPYLETGEIDLEAGGSLNDGAVFWCLGKIKSADADIVAGDQVSGYLLAVTSFDGSLSRRIQFTPTRVVCWNTLSWAIEDAKKEQTFTTRHTKNMKDRVSDAMQRIDIAKAKFHQATDQYKVLASKKMNEAQQADYFRSVLAGDKEEISERMENKIGYVIDLRDMQREFEPVRIENTAWEAYNAMTRYITHDYGRSQDTRLAGQWYGASQKLNRDALTLALQ